MYKPKIKSTKRQRNNLHQCGTGTGLIVYKSRENVTTEAEFYLDPNGQLRYVKSGTPLRLTVTTDEGERTIIVRSQYT